jgi:hypothetical protein
LPSLSLTFPAFSFFICIFLKSRSFFAGEIFASSIGGRSGGCWCVDIARACLHGAACPSALCPQTISSFEFIALNVSVRATVQDFFFSVLQSYKAVLKFISWVLIFLIAIVLFIVCFFISNTRMRKTIYPISTPAHILPPS